MKRNVISKRSIHTCNGSGYGTYKVKIAMLDALSHYQLDHSIVGMKKYELFLPEIVAFKTRIPEIPQHLHL